MKSEEDISIREVLATGEIQNLIQTIYEETGCGCTAVVLHPDYLPGYMMLCSLPVIRSEHAPKDSALVAWGFGR